MSPRRAARSVTVETGDACWRASFPAMASDCQVLYEQDDKGEAYRLASIAAAEVWRIEDKFSRYLPGNDIARIGMANGEPVTVDAETAQLISFAKTLYDLSHGRFDITSGALRRVWRFDGRSNLPTREAVAKVLQLVGWHQAEWDPPVLRLPPGMEIDLGGIGKEYAVDRVTKMLREASDVSCLVNLGGDLAVSCKTESNQGWCVGIEATNAPEGIPESLLYIQVGALATSGDARRFLVSDGVRYGHLLDPRTGWPVPDTPHSVTVAADTCTQAGMVSTLAILAGKGAEAFLDAQELDYWCAR